MAGGSLMMSLVLVVQFSLFAHIEDVAANVDSRKEKKHEKFVPLVAFQCGFRNRFMSEDGAWLSDPSTLATCFSGKLDILKYCRKAYPKLDVTNIVEYSHEVEIPGWCREQGSSCRWTHTVRPYQCIVGEFHSEALQVPHGCRFGHINDRQSCNDYAHWKDAAYKHCKTKVVNDKRMAVRSFAVLEPCGLDLFTGVEFVCCPGDDKTEELEKKKVEGKETEDDDDDDYDDDDDDDDDDGDDDDDDDDDDGGNEDNDDGEYAEDSDDDDAKGLSAKSVLQDPYFKMSDPVNEHERFKEAQQRMEKRHRARINKVMREWSDLEARYKKMKKTDEKGAEAFKKEMTSRFQKTVTSLEEENKEQKKQLEDVHEERVQAHLNEKKRQATHDYRASLAVQMGAPNKHNVLKTLKTYIRAEEKDRTHMINRFRHLLRTDRDEAETYEPILIHQLRYIDLRINGTLAMLRDFPGLERQVRPIAVEFWTDYRRENTPEVAGDEYTLIGGDEQNIKLVHYYKDSYDRLHNPSRSRKTTLSMITVSEPKKVLHDLDEGGNSYDEEENSDASVEARKQSYDNTKKIVIEKIVQRRTGNKFDKKRPTAYETDNVDEDDEDDIEDTDEEPLSSSKSVERELHVEIEPIVSEPVRVHDLPPRPSYARHEPLQHFKMSAEDASASMFKISTNLLLIFVSAATVIFIVFATVLVRQRPRRRGFIEVDVCTPGERHVNGMQVNGYENPTYSFFDNKA
uniref:A4_EXTRA domain-containing protein n=2 Tax=Wuchereria bancrofti TaxID=6293 RepID=A0AAF5PH76_WUCBA